MSNATLEEEAVVPPDLMKAAMELSPRVRARLASALLESLDQPPDDPKAVADAWRVEFARRIEEIKSGKVELVDGRATLKRLREELREKHGI
jgi:putative addiction module component (TIGR02574 family)